MIQGQCEFIAGETDITATVSSLTDGRVLENSIATTNVIRIPLGASQGQRHRTLSLRPFGIGADNSAFTLSLYGRRRTSAIRGRPASPRGELGALVSNPDGELRKIGDLVCTLSTATGVAGGAIGTGYRFADTLVWTASGWWSAIESALGVSGGAYSPASNIPGDFILPDLAGLEDVYIQATMTSATAANVLAELQT